MENLEKPKLYRVITTMGQYVKGAIFIPYSHDWSMYFAVNPDKQVYISSYDFIQEHINNFELIPYDKIPSSILSGLFDFNGWKGLQQQRKETSRV